MNCELSSAPLRAALPELAGIEQLASAPITAVHLWFDRPITDLPHAVLPGCMEPVAIRSRNATCSPSAQVSRQSQVTIIKL